jgi:Ca2+-binding EF-hand superfamily protein
MFRLEESMVPGMPPGDPFERMISMSSISSLSSSGGSAYASMRPQRPDPAQMSQDLFKKIDADSSGGIDAGELQSALDALSKSGGTNAQELLSKIDANGDGSIASDEFSQALQSGMPPPPPGPPPMSTGDFLRSRSSGDDADPLMALDADGNGGVSEAEFGLTASSDADLKSFFQAVDGDGDGSITAEESGAFKEKMEAQFASAGGLQGAPGDLESRLLSALGSLANGLYSSIAANAEGNAGASLLAAA